MANDNVLIINRDDIMRVSSLKGNIDEDKILPHVKTAQDIHLQPIIGSKLLDKLKALIADDTLDDPANENYKVLLNTWITPMMVFYVLWDAMPFLQYEIANGGIFQHQSENSATPDDKAVDKLISKFQKKAEFYGDRLTGYICDNTDLFPEVNTSTDGGELPAQGQKHIGGWVLD